MAKDTTPKKTKEKAPRPLIISALVLPLALLKFLILGFILASVVSIAVEFLGMTFIWNDNPNHAEEMFEKEYGYLMEYYTGSIGNWAPISFINTTIHWVADFFSNNSFFASIANWWHQPPTSKLGYGIKTTLPTLANYAQAAIFIILTIAMRISIFVLSSGWFILCGLLGLVNGLIQREIRREEGGLEHSFLFHFATSHLGVSLKIGWISYLASPWAIYPSLIIVPAGIAFGSTISLAASTFKKYL